MEFYLFTLLPFSRVTVGLLFLQAETYFYPGQIRRCSSGSCGVITCYYAQTNLSSYYESIKTSIKDSLLRPAASTVL